MANGTSERTPQIKNGAGIRQQLQELRDLLLIPSFMFSESAVIKRKPLSSTARRAGWVGCNLDLHRIAPEARIAIVITRSSSRRRGDESLTKKQNQRFLTSSPTNQTVIVPPEEVRARYTRLKPIREIKTAQRGWTLDVLNIVRRLVNSEGRAPRDPNFSGQSGTRVTRPSGEFTNADAYAFERELAELHPDNDHVKEKIRQQLQILRDAGLLIHLNRGEWKLP